MGLTSTLVRKVFFFVAVLAGVSLAISLLGRAIPGDAIDQITDIPEQRKILEAQLGLDRPFWNQYLRWCFDAVRFNFGESWVMRQGEPVAALIIPASHKSSRLVGLALLTNLGLATLLVAIFRFDGLSVLKRMIRPCAHTASVIPLFLLGYLVVMAVNIPTYQLIERHWIERPSWFALPAEETFLKYALAVFVLAIGNGTLADVVIHLESEVAQLLDQEFMTSVRARGAPIWRHFIPNILIPVTVIMTNKAGFLLGGVVVVEYVFNINGLGMMIWNAANQRDIPIVGAIAFLNAAVVAFLHLLSDLMQIGIDPRTRRTVAL